MLPAALRALGLEPALAEHVLAIGWATVELDRAAREIDPNWTSEDVSGSEHLGCACRRLAVPEADVPVLLLEPTSEGRLAATLARHDEGWAAVWLRDDPTQPAPGALSAARPGPLGVERLILGGPVAGPHRLLVQAGTILEP